ncbi:O-antigen ligase family protein [Nocardioides sp. GCM10028917]|uniref:O-antigen ligase family protein n=1 Tax=Nocardioides sp. GCM10028917 TaxID=3273408 RepID=UPI00361EB5FC
MTQVGTTTGTIRARAGVDATAILTTYLVLLWFVPSTMVVPALGSAGSPSNLLGVGCFSWWVWFHVQRAEDTGVGFQPVRAAMLGWLLIMLVVYAHAMASPILGDEISVADNGILRLLGMAGVLLLATDGITTRERHRVLLRRLALAAGVVAVLGLVQYATHQIWVDRLSIPGLTASTAGQELSERAGFARPSGTSTHPIEYGVVLAMALPLVIALAGGQHRQRLFFRVLLVPMILSIYLSVSRSAYVCALVALVVMALSWDHRKRIHAGFFLLVTSVAMYLWVPGLLGTIVTLFSQGEDDPSVASRTGSYEIAAQFITNSPLLGRGFGTFLPKYWILDNGYLGLLIEGGILGLVGLLAVIVAGVLAARRARSWSTDPDDRQMARALMASIMAGACGLAFFDTFAFPQTAGCVFLVIGLAGSMRRLEERAAPASDRSHPIPP